MSRYIVPIVEGQGDVEAVPILLRRLLYERAEHFGLYVAKPIRVPRDKLLKQGVLERYVELAVQTREGCEAVLVLFDADDDCPAQLGPKLTERAKTATGLPILVALAKTEFESWFVGSIESLRDTCSIDPSAESPADPESIRGAKGWIRKRMPSNRCYSEPTDQPTLAAKFDIDIASEHCPSFRRLCERFAELANRLGSQNSEQTEEGTSSST